MSFKLQTQIRSFFEKFFKILALLLFVYLAMNVFIINYGSYRATLPIHDRSFFSPEPFFHMYLFFLSPILYLGGFFIKFILLIPALMGHYVSSLNDPPMLLKPFEIFYVFYSSILELFFHTDIEYRKLCYSFKSSGIIVFVLTGYYTWFTIFPCLIKEFLPKSQINNEIFK